MNLTYKSFSTGPQSIKSLKGCVIFDTLKTSKKQFDSLIWPQVLGYKVWSSRRHSQTMCAPEPKPPTYSISTYHTTEYHILSKTTEHVIIAMFRAIVDLNVDLTIAQNAARIILFMISAIIGWGISTSKKAIGSDFLQKYMYLPQAGRL